MASPPEPVAVARHAMATRFEIVLHGHNPVALRAAGEEALAEIDRIENQISLYRNTSEIAHVNARAAREAVRVSPEIFRLLEQARHLSEITGGTFDPTIAPLIQCWGFMGGTGAFPEAAAVAEARARVGWSLVELHSPSRTVRFVKKGVMLDLGAIGKGYAIECASALLREAGVTSAILHGGTSTVQALGTLPDGAPWKVAIERPPDLEAGIPTEYQRGPGPEKSAQSAPARLGVLALRDEALSVSAVWGRAFQADGKTYGHVIDPRTGYPVTGAILAAVVLPSATETDALSTALLTQGCDGLGVLAELRPSLKAVVAAPGETGLRVEKVGIHWL